MSYIEKEPLLETLNLLKEDWGKTFTAEGIGLAMEKVQEAPTADVVEVVRCKDCKHFQPCFVLTSDGERRPYTEEEIKKGKIVTGDKGINCGSRCERFGYWEENKIPVWFSENDFCSYGERREE